MADCVKAAYVFLCTLYVAVVSGVQYFDNSYIVSFIYVSNANLYVF